MEAAASVSDAGATMSGMPLVARIGKPHGIHGEVTVQLHTDDPSTRLADGAVLTTQADQGSGVPRELTVTSTRVHRGIWLVSFAEIPDRTGAESLRGTHLMAPDQSAGPVTPSDNEWPVRELVGLAAVDPQGSSIGSVVDVITSGAQDRLVIELPDGHLAQVPFVQALVPTVDIDDGTIVVDSPPGLLDLGR